MEAAYRTQPGTGLLLRRRLQGGAPGAPRRRAAQARPAARRVLSRLDDDSARDGRPGGGLRADGFEARRWLRQTGRSVLDADRALLRGATRPLVSLRVGVIGHLFSCRRRAPGTGVPRGSPPGLSEPRVGRRRDRVVPVLRAGDPLRGVDAPVAAKDARDDAGDGEGRREPRARGGEEDRGDDRSAERSGAHDEGLRRVVGVVGMPAARQTRSPATLATRHGTRASVSLRPGASTSRPKMRPRGAFRTPSRSPRRCPPSAGRGDGAGASRDGSVATSTRVLPPLNRRALETGGAAEEVGEDRGREDERRHPEGNRPFRSWISSCRRSLSRDARPPRWRQTAPDRRPARDRAKRPGWTSRAGRSRGMPTTRAPRAGRPQAPRRIHSGVAPAGGSLRRPSAARSPPSFPRRPPAPEAGGPAHGDATPWESSAEEEGTSSTVGAGRTPYPDRRREPTLPARRARPRIAGTNPRLRPSGSGKT